MKDKIHILKYALFVALMIATYYALKGNSESPVLSFLTIICLFTIGAYIFRYKPLKNAESPRQARIRGQKVYYLGGIDADSDDFLVRITPAVVVDHAYDGFKGRVAVEIEIVESGEFIWVYIETIVARNV